MSELKSVRLALELAQRRRDAAGKVLAHALRLCQLASDQLQQLQAYALETQERWALGARSHCGPEILRNFQQFMERLQQAINLQQHALAQRELERENARRELLAADIRIASLKLLLDRRHTAAGKRAAAQAQKHSDEFAALQHRRMQAQANTLGVP